jgi:hypothetical protein
MGCLAMGSGATVRWERSDGNRQLGKVQLGEGPLGKGALANRQRGNGGQ